MTFLHGPVASAPKKVDERWNNHSSYEKSYRERSRRQRSWHQEETTSFSKKHVPEQNITIEILQRRGNQTGFWKNFGYGQTFLIVLDFLWLRMEKSKKFEKWSR